MNDELGMGLPAWQIWVITKLFVLFFAFIAFELAFMYLRRLDKKNGTNWGEDIGSQFKTNADAASKYYGLRFLAVCLALAILLHG